MKVLDEPNALRERGRSIPAPALTEDIVEDCPKARTRLSLGTLSPASKMGSLEPPGLWDLVTGGLSRQAHLWNLWYQHSPDLLDCFGVDF